MRWIIPAHRICKLLKLIQMLIPDTLLEYWTAKGKTHRTPGGWVSGNAVCCTHNNSTRDKRMRGGLLATDTTVSWNCFNCGFTAFWKSGFPLTTKTKKLMEWLDIPDDVITKCSFDAMRLRDTTAVPEIEKAQVNVDFFRSALPKNSELISNLVNSTTVPEQVIPVIEYLLSRNFSLDDYPWYWSYMQPTRLIIPFYYRTKIVGWTARAIDNALPKYLEESQKGYVFNLDAQTYDRKFALLCEGPLDAICLGGMAVMGNSISHVQRTLIDRLHKEIIVVPDRNTAGMELIKQAVEFGWSVSFPGWLPGLEDVNQVVIAHGRSYAMWEILQTKQTSKLKIQLMAKQWLHAAQNNKDSK